MNMELSLKDRIIIKGFLVFIALDAALDPIIYDWPEELEFELFIVCLIDLIITIVWAIKAFKRSRRLCKEKGIRTLGNAICNSNNEYMIDVAIAVLGLATCWYYHQGISYILLLYLAICTIARFIEPLKGMLRQLKRK